MKYACPKCAGRGWLPPPRSDSFPERCSACSARGSIRPGQLARALARSVGSEVSTMRRNVWAVERGTATRTPAERVLDAIVRVFPGALEINSISRRLELRT